jgi:hypothetical protein
MTASASPEETAPRRLTCARCGTAFDCSPAGGCWCAAEPYRLPMPDAAAQDCLYQDCLCPDCLRAKAAAQSR